MTHLLQEWCDNNSESEQCGASPSTHQRHMATSAVEQLREKRPVQVAAVVLAVTTSHRLDLMGK
eukprot:m.284627 g.284627  ORF g.284627 m.284627 type:complete len:64 (-) comp176907_c0_seq1:89-280(-)